MPWRMDRVGDLAEMRDDLVGRMAEIAARQHGGAMHRHRLDHDHRRAAAGALLVIAAMALAGQALLRHVGGVRAEDDAVAQRLVAQLQRLEEMGEGGRHGRIFAEPGTAGNGAFEIGTRLC